MRMLRTLLHLLPLAGLLLLAGCPAPPDQQSAGGADASGAAQSGETGGQTASGREDLTRWGEEGGIRLGSYMSLTGSTATYGQSSAKAEGMAVEEINAAGGALGGQKLSLVVEDSASKQEESRAAVQRLIDVHEVPVVIGEVASSNSLAAAPVCQSRGVPMLSPSSTNPTLTDKGDYIFRACFTDNLQGAYMAAFARDQGYKRGVVIQDNSSDYSKGLSDVINREFPGEGREILSTEAYTQGEKDFSAILTKLKDQNVDVIFVPGYYEDVGLIIKQARELGLNAPMIGGDGWDSPRLVAIAGEHLNSGCFFVNHYFKGDDRPEVQKFVSSYKERFGEEPDALAATAYDAVYIVADALERAGSADPAKLRDALAATDGYEGVTGTITINDQRDAVKPCVVLSFDDRQQILVTRMQPADVGA